MDKAVQDCTNEELIAWGKSGTLNPNFSIEDALALRKFCVNFGTSNLTPDEAQKANLAKMEIVGDRMAELDSVEAQRALLVYAYSGIKTGTIAPMWAEN